MRYKDRDKLIVRAKKLREEGLFYRQIANKLGIKSGNTIRLWLNPAARTHGNALCRRYHREHRPQIAEKDKEHHAAHRDRDNARSREYYKNHREEQRAYKKRRYAENAEQICAAHRQYYIEHKEEVKKRVKHWETNNKERCKENHRRYYTAHKDVYSAHAQLREAKIREYDTILQTEYDAIFERQKGLCIYCNKVMLTTGDSNHPDYKTKEHIYPIDRGGPHIVENIAFACRSCNSAKGSRTVGEWKPELISRVGNGICGKQNKE